MKLKQINKMESKNKKILTLSIMSLLLTLLLVAPILAIDKTVKYTPENVLYNLLVKFPEKMEMAFTFNEKLKLEKSIIIVDKRTQEINLIPQNENLRKELVIEKVAEIKKINDAFDKGVVDNEELRQKIEKKLKEIKEKQKDDLEDFPIFLPDKEIPKAIKCGGIAAAKCPEGYICTCDFSQDCKFDQIGTCTKKSSYAIDESKNKIMCPMIYAPVCGEDGKTYSNTCMATVNNVKIVSQGECKDITKQECKKVCMNIGTVNEGFYDTCTQKPIQIVKCSNDNNEPIMPPEPIKNPEPNPLPEYCYYDKYCQDMFKSCDFKCINGVCKNIMSFIIFSIYPGCNDVEPIPVPLPEKECSITETCQDKLRSCNAECINSKCVIVNSFVPKGNYPYCEGFGAL